ncbi:MAG TPA: phytanoyl-CoA dioxygenase family protein [Steroidobacteraceae bacterium]|nr:phytanoyl-CoA dioxygenase family protein [Steroidobacteraceae bacterium]
MKASDFLRPAIWSYAAQRLCTWYPLRRPLSALVAARRPSHARSDVPNAERFQNDLRRDGIVMLPKFVSADTIARVKSHLAGATLNERFPPHRGGFTIDTVPQNVHVAEYTTDHILRCPDVIALANHSMLLEAAGRYLGCKPTISNISIWWSLPADGSAQEAENYHRDVDDWRFIKFFLFMNDVDSDGGPHCFVRGSHRRARFLRIRRVPDAEVMAAFDARDLLSIRGHCGDAFLEDTFGLHKGQPPIARRRLLLQVEYSVNPIAVYKYRPAAIAGAAIDGYINRLFLRTAG